MALINCPECDHQVSEIAEACPQCGAPVAKIVIEKKEELSTEEPLMSENEQIMEAINGPEIISENRKCHSQAEVQTVIIDKSTRVIALVLFLLLGLVIMVGVFSDSDNRKTSNSTNSYTSGSRGKTYDELTKSQRDRIIRAAAQNSKATEQEMREAVDAFYGK